MSRKRKTKRARTRAQSPSENKVVFEERPEIVRKWEQWWNMCKKSPRYFAGAVIGGIVVLAFNETFSELAPRACWYIGGIAPNPGWRVGLICASTLALFMVFRRVKHWEIAATVALIIVPYLLAVGAVRLWYPKDARAILLAAIDMSKGATRDSVFLMDLETRSANSRSNIVNLFYSDENNAFRHIAPGTTDDDVLRLRLALDSLKSRGLMEPDDRRVIEVERTVGSATILRVETWRTTEKGRAFYSRFFWTRRAPWLGFFTTPERFEPIQGSDPKLAEMQNMQIYVSPDPDAEDASVERPR